MTARERDALQPCDPPLHVYGRTDDACSCGATRLTGRALEARALMVCIADRASADLGLYTADESIAANPQ